MFQFVFGENVDLGQLLADPAPVVGVKDGSRRRAGGEQGECAQIRRFLSGA
jgi:hypothetical protein